MQNVFITIFMFICFYSSAGSIQPFPVDRRGSGQGSFFSSWEKERKNRAANVSVPALLLLICSLYFFPAFPTPPAAPATLLPPPSSRMRALLCVCRHGLIVALISSSAPLRAPFPLRIVSISRAAVSSRTGIAEIRVPGADASRCENTRSE